MKDRTWIVIVGLVCCTILIGLGHNGTLNSIMDSFLAGILTLDIYGEAKARRTKR